MPPAFLLLLFFFVLLFPDRGGAQEVCPEGRVDHLVIDNHSIFDPESLPKGVRLRWAYELANRIHVRTREGLIRRELLFEEGDCFDPHLLRESARILREFRFIARADVHETSEPDGSRRVVVDTRDEWTTQVFMNARFEGGFRFEGFGIVEENFLGQGVTLGAFAITYKEQRDVGAILEVPRVGRTGWDVRFGGTGTRVGSSWDQAILHPFRGEVGTRAFRQQFQQRDDLFAYVLSDGTGDLTHLTLPLRVERAEISGAVRAGEPGRWLVLGGGLSRDRIAPGSLAEAEVIRNQDFSDPLEPPPGLTDPIAHQLLTRESVRLNLLVGLRHLEYRTRTGLDALRGVQDVPVGFDGYLAAGRSLGSVTPERPRESHLGGMVRGGFSGNDLTGFLSLRTEARFEEAQVGRNQGLQDILAEGHMLAYLHLDALPGHATVARASYLGGWRTTTPFQLILGGIDGVRGYGEAELPVGRRAVFSLEHRTPLPNPFPELADLGATLFGDLGQGWAGDAPHAGATGWRGTVGFGLRLGFPAGSSAVIRADIAFPVDGESDGGGPIFRVTAREWIGLLHPLYNLQLARSRRTGITGEFPGVAR